MPHYDDGVRNDSDWMYLRQLKICGRSKAVLNPGEVDTYTVLLLEKAPGKTCFNMAYAGSIIETEDGWMFEKELVQFLIMDDTDLGYLQSPLRNVRFNLFRHGQDCILKTWVEIHAVRDLDEPWGLPYDPEILVVP